MKIKYYDKKIYARNENIKGGIIVIVCFLLGYITGCVAVNEELKKQNIEKQEHIVELDSLVEEQQVKINEQYVELDSLRESIYMYQVYGK